MNDSTLRRYFGLTIEELCQVEGVVCTFALNKFEKLVLKGKFAIDRHAGSIKFDDEVVLTVWGTEPPVLEKRAWNKGFFRLEIPLPIGVAIGLFETALAKLRMGLTTNRSREECLSFLNDSCLSDCQDAFAREGKRDSTLYREGFI